jgi:hypothetical protein
MAAWRHLKIIPKFNASGTASLKITTKMQNFLNKIDLVIGECGKDDKFKIHVKFQDTISVSLFYPRERRGGMWSHTTPHTHEQRPNSWTQLGQKSSEFFPPRYSQSPLQTDFTPLPPVEQKWFFEAGL